MSKGKRGKKTTQYKVKILQKSIDKKWEEEIIKNQYGKIYSLIDKSPKRKMSIDSIVEAAKLSSIEVKKAIGLDIPGLAYSAKRAIELGTIFNKLKDAFYSLSKKERGGLTWGTIRDNNFKHGGARTCQNWMRIARPIEIRPYMVFGIKSMNRLASVLSNLGKEDFAKFLEQHNITPDDMLEGSIPQLQRRLRKSLDHIEKNIKETKSADSSDKNSKEDKDPSDNLDIDGGSPKDDENEKAIDEEGEEREEEKSKLEALFTDIRKEIMKAWRSKRRISEAMSMLDKMERYDRLGTLEIHGTVTPEGVKTPPITQAVCP